jgi:hypothetical protein
VFARRGRCGSVLVVVVLPFLQPGVQQVDVVNDYAIEQTVELFGVDAMRTFHFAVESGCGRFDADVINPLVQGMPIETSLEFRTVIGLDDPDLEGQPSQDVVHELDRGLLV